MQLICKSIQEEGHGSTLKLQILAFILGGDFKKMRFNPLP